VPLFLWLDLCVFLKNDSLREQKKLLETFCIHVLRIKKPSIWKAFKDSIRTELSS
jgi:hypothetical protein